MRELISEISYVLPAVRQAELMLRIVVAVVCGGFIGMERSRRFKDAGVRTHCMVASASAVMMLVSKYGFADLASAGVLFPGTRGADPARIAAQIVSGVSFLGVGVIYRDRNKATRGLTTAAGIWAVAGVGMAVGAGMYYVGLFFTCFVLVLQTLTHRIAFGKDRFFDARLELLLADEPKALGSVSTQMEREKLMVLDSEVRRTENGCLLWDVSVRARSHAALHSAVSGLMDDPVIRSVKLMEEE